MLQPRFLRHNSESGAVALEFAIVFPVFLFMLLFLLDAGRFLLVQIALNSAAEVGARYVAMSANVTTTTEQTRLAVPDSLVRLAMLDGTVNSLGVYTTAEVCPIGAENYTQLNPANGVYEAAPDALCSDLNLGYSCTTSPAGWRAVSAAQLSFKWITPVGLIQNLAYPDDLSNGSEYFMRSGGDYTTVEGRARQLCQN